MNESSRVSQLSVISDADAAGLVREDSYWDLADRITAMPHKSATRPRPRTAPRRWLIAVPVAAAIALGALVASSLGNGAHPGPLGPPSAEAAALVFTRHGRYIDVKVLDPLADQKRYRAEFRAHGLDITLKLVPVSPSLVGTVVYVQGSSAIKVISARGKCYTGGGGDVCPVGLKVPVDYPGKADLVFGRAARPGERYESTVSATARGEALHGLHLAGRTVSAVLRMIAKRHVTVPAFHVTTPKGIGEIWPLSKVPLSWYVYGADPWAPGQVMLWVGSTREPAPVRSQAPGTPVPSPAPTSAGS